MFYRELADAQVPAETKRAAAEALAYGCRSLGLALPPEVIWCLPVTDPVEHARVVALPKVKGSLDRPGYRLSLREAEGLTDGFHYVLWLRADRSERETAITALHELGHVWYRLKRTPALGRSETLRAAEEKDVEAWAQAIYLKLAV